MLVTCPQARVTFEADFLQFVRVRGLLVLYQEFFLLLLYYNKNALVRTCLISMCVKRLNIH